MKHTVQETDILKKRIKQYMHPDYYYAHEEQDWDELEQHAGGDDC